MPTDTEVGDISFRMEQTLHTAAALHELCNEQIQKMRSGDEHPFVVVHGAAPAPTYQDALDVTGDALRRLAELTRAEVHHG